MSDDFGTVNVKRGDRAREIEIMRQQYRQHHDALRRLAADAPTEHLASEYQRLTHEIDLALAKLDELDGKGGAAASAGGFSAASPATVAAPVAAATFADQRLKTEPGTRTPPIAPSATTPRQPAQTMYEPPSAEPNNSRSRVALMVVAGIFVLALIAWLIIRASGDRRPSSITATTTESAVADTVDTAAGTTSAAPAVQPVAPPPGSAAAGGSIKVTPTANDYGTIRKGTRAVRQFEVTNLSSTPVTIQVSRSSCRCLYYDYHEKVAAKGKETITVTVDGAKAKAGTLQENLLVTSKSDPDVQAQMRVMATIQ